MLLNVNKCKVMHVGYNNPRYDYEMNGVVLDTVDEDKNLGMIQQSQQNFGIY